MQWFRVSQTDRPQRLLHRRLLALAGVEVDSRTLGKSLKLFLEQTFLGAGFSPRTDLEAPTVQRGCSGGAQGRRRPPVTVLRASSRTGRGPSGRPWSSGRRPASRSVKLLPVVLLMILQLRVVVRSSFVWTGPLDPTVDGGVLTAVKGFSEKPSSRPQAGAAQ